MTTVGSGAERYRERHPARVDHPSADTDADGAASSGGNKGRTSTAESAASSGVDRGRRRFAERGSRPGRAPQAIHIDAQTVERAMAKVDEIWRLREGRQL